MNSTQARALATFTAAALFLSENCAPAEPVGGENSGELRICGFESNTNPGWKLFKAEGLATAEITRDFVDKYASWFYPPKDRSNLLVTLKSDRKPGDPIVLRTQKLAGTGFPTNWSGYAMLLLDAYNESNADLSLHCTVTSTNGQQAKSDLVFPSRRIVTRRISLNDLKKQIDLAQISSLELVVDTGNVQGPCRLLLDNLRLRPEGYADIHIAHFGDSGVDTIYLPIEDHIDKQLEQLLRKAYGNPLIQTHMAARGGSHVNKFLDSNGEKNYQNLCLNRFPEIDIAFICYGANDKEFLGGSMEEWKRRLNRLCDTLQKDYPGVLLILQTGYEGKYNLLSPPAYPDLKADKPFFGDYSFIWKGTHEVAKERGFPVVDLDAALETEYAKGNWDWLIRNQELAEKHYGTRIILDNSKDAERKGDYPAWFREDHPNKKCVDLWRDLCFAKLRELYPQQLPQSGKRR